MESQSFESAMEAQDNFSLFGNNTQFHRGARVSPLGLSSILPVNLGLQLGESSMSLFRVFFSPALFFFSELSFELPDAIAGPVESVRLKKAGQSGRLVALRLPSPHR